MAAAHFGTGPMAGHQVIHQVLQLQLAVTWAFLSVGQSFVSNEFHAQYSSAGASAKAALNMSNRICFWGIVVSIALGSCTWMMRQALPRLFLQEDGVLQLVAQSMHPACLMLGLAWNNVTEGCLLGIGDKAFVVGVYPWAVGVCVALMLVMTLLNRGLPGIWWGLLMYYTGLVVPFACRLWIPRFRPPQLRTRLLPPAMLNPAA